MAKVRSPLFSLGASGKLANSLVYMNWKGIDDVRMWLKPANPKTASQQTQRGRLSDAVDEWHTAGFNSDDFAAFDRYATILPAPMSGFNAFVSLYVKAKVAEKTWTSLKNASITPAANQITVEIECESDKTAKLYWGTSPSRMPTEVDGTYDSENKKWTFTISDLSSGTTIFFYIKNTAEGEGARTGIYKATTS